MFRCAEASSRRNFMYSNIAVSSFSATKWPRSEGSRSLSTTDSPRELQHQAGSTQFGCLRSVVLAGGVQPVVDEGRTVLVHPCSLYEIRRPTVGFVG